MSRKWTVAEEKSQRQELVRLYVDENKTIKEIAGLVKCGESTVYDRLVRLGISSQRSRKLRYNNQRCDIIIPKDYSTDLAEFIGMMLGDGHLTPTQVTVTLGKKDEYTDYAMNLIERVLGARPRKSILRNENILIYLGSTVAVRWLGLMGLVNNKVRAQVDVPHWVLQRQEFMRAALRGLFDTDGSVYKLRFGTQISFCNHSIPMLHSVKFMLASLGFHPSKVSAFRVYLTRRGDVSKFYEEIGFGNGKHIRRFKEIFGQVVP